MTMVAQQERSQDPGLSACSHKGAVRVWERRRVKTQTNIEYSRRCTSLFGIPCSIFDIQLHVVFDRFF